MNDQLPRPGDDDLDAYLDNRMSDQQRLAFEKRMQQDEELRGLVQRDMDIHDLLKQRFCPPTKSAEDLLPWLAASQPSHVDTQTRSRSWLVVACALAACIAVVLTIWNHNRPQLQPFFEPRPLVALYQETIDSGFEPYYFCEDDERFAHTLEQRQGTPLVLRDLPPDRRMIGLSYLGGLSRETTAILCYVADQPVVVFVGRSGNDQAKVTTPAGSNLYVHRAEIDQLVVYEVSPFSESKISDFLRLTQSR
ncbi:MAG: hypothetical protein MI861_03085 [Pirellulales bacterium]|nr:hypothetical protein [Pirellulales bacterium]